MFAITKNDLKIWDRLSIVTIGGFEPEKVVDDEGNEWSGASSDSEGTANFFVESYGLQPSRELDPEADGILETDYQDQDGLWAFSILIDSREVDAIRKLAEDAGYSILKAETVEEPIEFGDTASAVEILKHRDGWIVID